MAIINYLIEALDLKHARKYIKQGRKNYETLPDEIKEIYNNIFQGKSRKIIGEVEVDKHSLCQEMMNDILDICKRYPKKISEDRINPTTKAVIYQPNNKDNGNIIDRIDVVLSKQLDCCIITFNSVGDDVNSDMEYFKDGKISSSEYKWNVVYRRLKNATDKSKYKELDLLNTKFTTAVSNSSGGPCQVVLSKHPYDVAGMSTNRRWQSCKSLGVKHIDKDTGKVSYTNVGMNSFYLNTEVGHLLIAYLVPPKTKETKDILEKPFCRVLIIPCEGSDGYGLFVSDQVYGIKEYADPFRQVVRSFINKYSHVYNTTDTKTMIDDYYQDGDEWGEEDLYEEGERIFRSILEEYPIANCVDDYINYETLAESDEYREDIERFARKMKKLVAYIQNDIGIYIGSRSIIQSLFDEGRIEDNYEHNFLEIEKYYDRFDESYISTWAIDSILNVDYNLMSDIIDYTCSGNNNMLLEEIINYMIDREGNFEDIPENWITDIFNNIEKYKYDKYNMRLELSLSVGEIIDILENIEYDSIYEDNEPDNYKPLLLLLGYSEEDIDEEISGRNEE